MNQEQLLDHVAEILKTETDHGAGAILLTYDEDFKAVWIPIPFTKNTKFLACLDVNSVKSGLQPSAWLELAKKIWACKSSSTDSIKFPGQPSAGGGGPGRRPKPQDEPPKVG